MSDVQVKVINRSRHSLPEYHTEHAACVDLRANIDKPVTLQPMERALVSTGIFFALPPGYEAQIRPRSGLALKHGISLVNAPGTIDADFRGELAVIMINLGQEPFVINDGDRIAQMRVSRHDTIVWQEVEVLDQTVRGDGAYGHTGR
jgi:dUTP pyrophosphatase